MNATYTAREIEIASEVLKLAMQELTIGQRMELGKVDYPTLAEEVVKFFAKQPTAWHLESEENLLAGTSKQFKSLYKFGVITIEIEVG